MGLWDIPLAPNDLEFMSDLRLLARRGFTLDVLGGPNEMEKITRLASAIPNLRIVVDHSAGVRVTGNAPDANWVEGIKSLAARRNIYMKVSGLVEGTGMASAPTEGMIAGSPTPIWIVAPSGSTSETCPAIAFASG